MHVLIRRWIVCAILAWAGAAPAAPGTAQETEARQQHRLAAREADGGNYKQALELIEQGLGSAPKDLPLLELKGGVLLKMQDYTGAIAAYRAFLDGGAKGF